MSNDDIIYRFRVALFARAQEVGVSQACREFNVHRSTYYRHLPRYDEKLGTELVKEEGGVPCGRQKLTAPRRSYAPCPTVRIRNLSVHSHRLTNSSVTVRDSSSSGPLNSK
jgi:hypothetical protein